MFLEVENLLAPGEVQTIAEIARQAKFIDGRLSNPHNIAKDNVIADVANDPLARQAAQIALTAFQRSEEARNFVFPSRVALPTLLRYDPGMKYGAHVDAAFLPVGPQPLRSDVSCTFFISNPGDYQGGELVIHLGTEVTRIKGNAGSAVLYPSTRIHQVTPVTAGARTVMITFIESQIADEMQRELLYTLNEVRALEGLKMDWRNRTQLEYVSANLLRMWSR
jgi:PKHD-type hydroxylase